jgi:hypothetical protein
MCKTGLSYPVYGDCCGTANDWLYVGYLHFQTWLGECLFQEDNLYPEVQSVP